VGGITSSSQYEENVLSPDVRLLKLKQDNIKCSEIDQTTDGLNEELSIIPSTPVLEAQIVTKFDEPLAKEVIEEVKQVLTSTETKAVLYEPDIDMLVQSIA
jgi:hypothetical protein